MSKFLYNRSNNSGERRVLRKPKCSKDRKAHRQAAEKKITMIDYLTSQTFLLMILKMLIVFRGLINTFAYLSLVEKRVMAFVQIRPGPNRVGPFGLLQPIADGLKFLFKKQVQPTAA